MIQLIFFLQLLVFKPPTVCSFTQSVLHSKRTIVASQQQHYFLSPILAPTGSIVPIPRYRTSFQAITNNDELSSENTFQHGQYALAKLYYGASLLYCGQVLLAMKKYRLTLEGLNGALGGPFMAAGITFLLGESSRNGYLGLDTFKRLNGVLFLYALICLCIISALIPKLHELDGILLLLGSASTIFLATRGYLSGLLTDGGKRFLPETFRLFQAAASLTTSLPPKNMTYPNFFRLLTIAIRKAVFLGGIAKVLLFRGDSILQKMNEIVPKLSQVAKLTLLGGSLVTSLSLEHNEMAQRMTAGPINIMAFSVFSLMSAFTLATASNTLQFVDGVFLSICALCSASEGFNYSMTKSNSDS